MGFGFELQSQADTGTHQQLRADTHKKRRADHMVEECRTKQKVDEKRTQKVQKEAERVADQMGGRGAPAASQSTRSRKLNPKIFGPEFQWTVLFHT